MPPQRTPLGVISGNRFKGCELSPYIRGQITGARLIGRSFSTIAKALKVDRSTVRYTTLQAPQRVDGQSIPRKPRQKSYTEHDVRSVLRYVRLHPKHTYAQVLNDCGVNFKVSTLKRILKEAGITNWRAKRRPLLTEAIAAKRLAWCLSHRGWTAEEWGLIVWSDECSVERGRGKAQEWVFRTPAQKWDKNIVQTYDSGRNMKVMVWGAFWDTRRSNLYIIDRDFESAKHGYSARLYLEVLEAEVRPMFADLDPGYLFMQDNAPIHCANTVKQWFIDLRIQIVERWPPYSPDLNPIEHIWWHLKRRVVDMFPEVAASKSKSEYSRQRLESCLQAAWDTLDDSLFQALIESMPSRIEACIAAQGWHTKY